MGIETNIEEILTALVQKFNEKVNEDPNIFENIKDLKRRIKIKIEDEGVFYTELSDGKLKNFEKVSDDIDSDITVETTRDVFLQLISQQLSPVVAYVNGLVKIKAPLRDLLLLKDLLGGKL